MATPDDIETLGAYNTIKDTTGNLQFIPSPIDQSKDILHRYCEKYNVPQATRDELHKINMRGQPWIDPTNNGAQFWGNFNLLQYRNDLPDKEGVIAHEVAHKWWGGLSDNQRQGFIRAINSTGFGFGRFYERLPIGDPVEAYADIYRYHSKDMPDRFKPFYAGLLPV